VFLLHSEIHFASKKYNSLIFIAFIFGTTLAIHKVCLPSIFLFYLDINHFRSHVMLNDEFADEYEMEMDMEFDMEADMEFETSANLPFDEAEEMELAAELLEHRSDEELEYFLGKLAKKAGRFLKSKTAKSIGRTLKGVTKKALPVAGAAVGNVLMPGAGGMVGGALGNLAASLFEMELEGMSPEDMEFETARRIVRLAGSAGQRAAAMERKGGVRNAAKAAVVSAAKTHAPALLRKGRTNSTHVSDFMRNNEYEMEMEHGAQANMPFDEEQEMELAAELLEYHSDDEMEYFLSNLVKEASRKALNSKTARSIGRTLSKARSALKTHAPAIGESIGGGIGTGAAAFAGSAIKERGYSKLGDAVGKGLKEPATDFGKYTGRKFGEWVASHLELELEGVSPEDMEFETARRIVRLAGAAGQRAAMLKRNGVGGNTATAALISATKACTPALTGNTRDIPGSLPNSGSWVRRENQIVLTGV
jgi:hypothetical protein